MTTAESKNGKTLPTRPKRIVKSELVKPGKIYKETVLTKRVGSDGQFILAFVVREDGQLGGYMHPIHKRLLCDATAPSEYGTEYWDIVYAGYLYQRVSHEGNESVLQGYKPKNSSREYHRTLTVSLPSKRYWNDKGEIDIRTEEKFRDYLVGILCADTNKNPIKSFTAWSPNHSRTKMPYESLDRAMTDESVDAIVTNYYLPEAMERKKVYEFLIENKTTGFYSRKISDGRFSRYAVEEFGFPGDAVMKETE
jgi:hypothetical protein